MSEDALTGENLFNDPYPVYARLRRKEPVALFEGTHEYFVTRWADCRTIGTNDAAFGPSDSDNRPEARVFGMPSVLSMSGPEHQALRAGIDYEVQQNRVDGYIEERARPIAVKRIEAISQRGEADLIQELFGVGRSVAPKTRHHCDDTKRYIDALGLDEKDRRLVFEGNTRRVYPRLDQRIADLGL